MAQREITVELHARKVGNIRYYWLSLIASNGEILMHSEDYTAKASAKKSAKLLPFKLVDKSVKK